MSKRMRVLLSIIVFLAFLGGSVFAGQSSGPEKAGELPAGPLLPWEGEEVVWDGFGSDLGMVNDPTMPVYAEYLKTTGNARVEWQTFPWNDYDQKLNLYLQSGDLPDLIWARDVMGKVATFGMTDMFLDWNKYMDRMPNMQRYIDEYPFMSIVLTDDGKRLGITDVANAEYVGEGWFYNPEILAKAGHSEPPETIEELIDVMRDVKKKVPGVDAYLSYWGLGYVESAIRLSMHVGGGVDYDPQTKKWIYSPAMNPDYKQFVMYMNEMYELGAFNPDAIAESISNEKVNELISEGNMAFIRCYYGAMWNYFGKFGVEAPFEGMAPPTYKGNMYYNITVPHDKGNYWAYMSPKDVKMPELLASYIDNIMSKETYLLFEWGIEGEDYRILSDGRPEYLDTYTADERAERGVYNFWDPRYIHFSDYYNAWFSKNLWPGHPGRQAAIDDVNRCKTGVAEPIWDWPKPQLPAEQNDEIGKIMTPMNTFLSEEKLKFITGKRPMSEWDEFIATLTKMGDIDKVLDYYNAGKTITMGERRWPNTFE